MKYEIKSDILLLIPEHCWCPVAGWWDWLWPPNTLFWILCTEEDNKYHCLSFLFPPANFNKRWWTFSLDFTSGYYFMVITACQRKLWASQWSSIDLLNFTPAAPPITQSSSVFCSPQSQLLPQIDPSVPQLVFTITEKAPIMAFSWLKTPTSAFTFKTLLRHYAKRALTPR